MIMNRKIYEVDKDDVDISSFELKDRLNPKFWNGGKLDILARKKLLTIARDFISKFDLADFQIHDVIMIGSLANYNWDEEYSDIDLHIVVDFAEINDDVDLVRDFFDAVKDKWNKTHKNILIYGYPVEVYVQDTNDRPTATGVYSVLFDEWVIEPSLDDMRKSEVDDDKIKDTAAKIMTDIDNIEERYLLVKDKIGNEDLMELIDDADKIYDRIKDIRKSDLGATGTEISTGNLIFKTVRRNGYLGKLHDIKDKLYDLMTSLE